MTDKVSAGCDVDAQCSTTPSARCTKLDSRPSSCVVATRRQTTTWHDCSTTTLTSQHSKTTWMTAPRSLTLAVSSSWARRSRSVATTRRFSCPSSWRQLAHWRTSVRPRQRSVKARIQRTNWTELNCSRRLKSVQSDRPKLSCNMQMQFGSFQSLCTRINRLPSLILRWHSYCRCPWCCLQWDNV